MQTFKSSLMVAAALLMPALAQKSTSPFAGRWDFNIATHGGTRACWLGVTEKGGNLEVWYQPPGGNVYQVKDVHVDGSHLMLTLSAATSGRPAMTWDLEASGGKLTGVQKSGDDTTRVDRRALAGTEAQRAQRHGPIPNRFSTARTSTGWEPIGDPAASHWKVEDGLLLNTAHGANLKSTRKFEDFKVHYEVNCPDDGNSGFYLRGRYEVQIEYEPLTSNPPERRIGSIYGRIAPQRRTAAQRRASGRRSTSPWWAASSR